MLSFMCKLPRASILLGRLALAGVLVTFMTGAVASADEADTVSIFDVRRNLPLEPNEPVYRDFYLNAGPEAGLKKGMFVTVVRRLPIHDPLQNKAQATLTVEVAKVQIVHVERNISVARLVDDVETAFRPILEFEGIMIGDVLDLTTVTMEGPKKKGTRQPGATATAAAPAPVAEEAPQTPTTVVLPAPPAPELPAKTSEGDRKVDSIEAPKAVENNSSPAVPAPDMVRAAHEPDKII